ncbi:hypothetical protein ABFY09_01465 [Marinomonas sp. 5E14-1]|uniref:hypothetical protein n=1 Tax=Marinomonas sp. 5E14-1 TaxID=3153922 RepID=UPI0032642AE8
MNHGDLYTHNAVINQSELLLFSDFGAASKYENLTEAQQQGIETNRATGRETFIVDMLSLCHERDKGGEAYQALKERVLE